ncbi:DUF4270 family protein [uncultured Draconibacterium sp.]|uniref:DUF4270 family protein n=1 Tax=uncultured Draconibacterium sp. TaxID=1573823 RepID=UPI003216B378
MKSKTIIYLLGLLMLLSCESEEDLLISLGDNFINSETTVALVDTLSVELSTFKLDSVATSGTGYMLVGKYSDLYLGEVRATGYLQIDYPTTVDVDDDEIFDSICIELPYSGMAYGDTLAYQTISLHRVLADIEPADEDESNLYNTTSFPYDEEALAVKTFRAKPNKYENLEIRLADELGTEFLDLLKDENDGIDGSSDFIEYFKGLAFKGSENNTALLSFTADTTLKIVLYTHLIGEEKTDHTFTFPLSSSCEQFNSISNDVSGLPVENVITQREEISSDYLSKMAYLQAGMGYIPRVDFPSLGKILEVDHKNYLYKAVLVMRPVINKEDDVALPENLILYTTDKHNNVVSELSDDDGNTVYGNYYYDEYYNENTYYSFDVTDFLYDELADNYVDPDNGLLIMFGTTEFKGSLSRIVFDGREGTSYRPYLNLYYVFYD